jgi:hypothetical protein
MKGNIPVRDFTAVINGLGGHWELLRDPRPSSDLEAG